MNEKGNNVVHHLHFRIFGQRWNDKLSKKVKITPPILLLALYCLVATFALFLSVRQLGAAERPSPSPVLRSASELDYPPFALVKKDGSADGFSVEEVCPQCA